MKSRAMQFAVAAVFLFLVGCGAHNRYEWSNYDTKLYNHYKDSSQPEQFIQELKEAVEEAESAGQVPPGIYAEYGFVLYEQGNSLQAVQYFRKEADKWPESRMLMTKMIDNVQKRGKKQDDKAKTAVTAEPAVSQAATMPAEVTK
jgi:hypothetical protein